MRLERVVEAYGKLHSFLYLKKKEVQSLLPLNMSREPCHLVTMKGTSFSICTSHTVDGKAETWKKACVLMSSRSQ
jgi:hypothetical protein